MFSKQQAKFEVSFKHVYDKEETHWTHRAETETFISLGTGSRIAGKATYKHSALVKLGNGSCGKINTDWKAVVSEAAPAMPLFGRL